jgi:hypothetical protein
MISFEETIKEFVKESIRGVYYLGFKKSSINDIENRWPIFFNYLVKNYENLLTNCTVVVKSRNKVLPEVPYVLLPDGMMTIVTWDDATESPVYSQSEDLARSIERFV